jgi:Zinc finger, C3HC4 type (RING finger)
MTPRPRLRRVSCQHNRTKSTFILASRSLAIAFTSLSHHGLLNYPFYKSTSCRCGHTFCRECLDEALYGAEKCPICRAVIRKKDIFQNLVLRSLIGDLEMRCQNGCEWTSKVAEYESHRKNDCGMQTIQCEVRGCDFQCLRKDMIRHITSEEGIKAHVDHYVAERIAEIGAEVESEVTCKVKEVLLAQWL